MGVMDSANTFAAKGWWQAGLVKLTEYALFIVVCTLAAHFLPASTANTVINGASNVLGVPPIVITQTAITSPTIVQ